MIVVSSKEKNKKQKKEERQRHTEEKLRILEQKLATNEERARCVYARVAFITQLLGNIVNEETN